MKFDLNSSSKPPPVKRRKTETAETETASTAIVIIPDGEPNPGSPDHLETTATTTETVIVPPSPTLVEPTTGDVEATTPVETVIAPSSPTIVEPTTTETAIAPTTPIASGTPRVPSEELSPRPPGALTPGRAASPIARTNSSVSEPELDVAKSKPPDALDSASEHHYSDSTDAAAEPKLDAHSPTYSPSPPSEAAASPKPIICDVEPPIEPIDHFPLPGEDEGVEPPIDPVETGEASPSIETSTVTISDAALIAAGHTFERQFGAGEKWAKENGLPLHLPGQWSSIKIQYSKGSSWNPPGHRWCHASLKPFSLWIFPPKINIHKYSKSIMGLASFLFWPRIPCAKKILGKMPFFKRVQTPIYPTINY